ncbi:MAG: S8 family serine peptidase, partial [Bryobacteraceae bacterium]
LPAGSLQGRIALILRGDCTFEAKLNNAQQAGAVAALVYAAKTSPDPISMAAGASTLPAEMVSYDDGIAIKEGLAAQPALFGTLRFTVAAVPRDANRLAGFSAAGPNVDRGIKPDLVAVGADMYVATQKLDTAGEMYNATGYIVVDGTSFSTPLVAGAAAILKSARPGLTVDQYRSLLINTASSIDARLGVPSSVQQSGAGQLNALAAVNGTVTVYPTALNFASGGPDPNLRASVTLTNVGATAETYTLSVTSGIDGSAPRLSSDTVQLEAGASINVPVRWSGSSLAAGAHEGFVRISGSSSGVETRVPYWYAVTSITPAHISILDSKTSARRGTTSRDAILLRVTDSAGLPLTTPPDVSITSGGGAVSRIVSYDLDVPGLYGVDLRLGPLAGPNVVLIQAGEISTSVSITGN